MFFAYHRLLVDASYPLMAITSIYFMLIFANYMREESQRSKSGPPSPISVADAGRAAGAVAGKAGARRRDAEMTIMFSDVRGFTTISETSSTIRRA